MRATLATAVKFKLMARFILLLLIGIALGACGGGTPYTGLWQCEDDATSSLEITRFEEYFIVTARAGDEEYKREASFENEVLAVGKNNVGAPMSLELTDAGITCTKPPNFCRCSGVYTKVDALPVGAQAVPDKPSAADTTSADSKPNWDTSKQIIRDREAYVSELTNGGKVHVFDHASNEQNEVRIFDWAKLKYYYLPQLTLEKLESGKLAQVLEGDGDPTVSIRLALAKLDKFELMEDLHKAKNNPKIQTSHVVPLSYERLTLEVVSSASASSASTTISGADLQSATVDAALLLSPNSTASEAKEMAAAINNGVVIPQVTIEIEQINGKAARSWPITTSH